MQKKSKFYGGHLGFLKSILKIQDLLPFEYFHVSFRLTFAQLNNFITKQHTDSRVFINLQIVNNANWTWLFPDYSLIFQSYLTISCRHMENGFLDNFCSLCSIEMSIFLKLYKKNKFFTIYSNTFKGHNSLKLFSIDLFFISLCSGAPNEVFLLFELYHFPSFFTSLFLNPHVTYFDLDL